MSKLDQKWIDYGYDLLETSFSGSNNQTIPSDVIGFNFPTNVRSFFAHVSVTVDATQSLYESFEVRGINKAGSWEIAISSSFDNSGVDFSISSGQLQYTSGNYTGFNSLVIKFRAVTTEV